MSVYTLQRERRSLFLSRANRRVLRSIQAGRSLKARVHQWSTAGLSVTAQQDFLNSLPDFGGAGRRMFPDFGTRTAARENLGGIQKTVGIKYTLHAHHRVQIGLREDEVHEILLFKSDPVLTAQRSPDLHTKLHDLFAHSENLLDL